MVIILPSVKKTGTGFLYHKLLNEKVNLDRSPVAGRFTDNYVFCGHPTGPHWDRIRTAVASHISISPLRHPDAVTASWTRRGWSLRDLANSWSALFDLSQIASKHFWLPIDHRDRQRYLDAINAELRTQITTDWAPFHGAFGDNMHEHNPLPGLHPDWLMTIYG